MGRSSQKCFLTGVRRIKGILTVLILFAVLYPLASQRPKTTEAAIDKSAVVTTKAPAPVDQTGKPKTSSQSKSQEVIEVTKPQTPQPSEADIPDTVFCGSPAQRNYKKPNKANAALGREMAASYGWTGNQWTALLELWSCESQWNHNSINSESGAGGIPQAWPASKMATFGADYETNPATQIAWGLDYIKRVYGTPEQALAKHYAVNWY